MHAVYLPDVEVVMGANHGPGHGTGEKRTKKKRAEMRERDCGSRRKKKQKNACLSDQRFAYFTESGPAKHCESCKLCDLGRPLISFVRAKFG